jgi:hypothetical protein
LLEQFIAGQRIPSRHSQPHRHNQFQLSITEIRSFPCVRWFGVNNCVRIESGTAGMVCNAND